MLSIHFARHLVVTGLAALLWGAVATTAPSDQNPRPES